jgi:hypothetical protein
MNKPLAVLAGMLLLSGSLAASLPAVAPPSTASLALVQTAAASKPVKRPAAAPRHRAGPDADARKCLEFTRNSEVIRCANAYL